MIVKLSQVHGLPVFADGMSLAAYQRLGRLIRQFGPLKTIDLRIDEGDEFGEDAHIELTAAMDRLEKIAAAIQTLKRTPSRKVMLKPTEREIMAKWRKGR